MTKTSPDSSPSEDRVSNYRQAISDLQASTEQARKELYREVVSFRRDPRVEGMMDTFRIARDQGHRLALVLASRDNHHLLATPKRCMGTHLLIVNNLSTAAVRTDLRGWSRPANRDNIFRVFRDLTSMEVNANIESALRSEEERLNSTDRRGLIPPYLRSPDTAFERAISHFVLLHYVPGSEKRLYR